MIEPAADSGAGTSDAAVYRERLRTPWWWYLAGVVVGVLLGAEFDFVMPQSLVGLPVLIAIVLALAVVWRISAASVEVRGGAVVVGERQLPVGEIAHMYSLDYAQLRRVVGRHGDPLAFTFVRTWVGPGVQLVLTPPPAPPLPDDADDDGFETDLQPLREPYWLLSSRHPERLMAAVRAAQGTQA